MDTILKPVVTDIKELVSGYMGGPKHNLMCMYAWM